jgi:kinesin family member 12
MEETIKIIIRSRFLNQRELNNHENSCLSSPYENELFVHINQQTAYKFSCDLMCSSQMTQEQFFFSSDISSLLNSLFSGYRSCIFAYGQTGAGKTFTMIGPKNSLDLTSEGEANPQCGILGRSLVDLFKKLRNLGDEEGGEGGGIEYLVKISCLELYQENLYDLLHEQHNSSGPGPGTSSLQIREHPKTGFFVDGCTLIACPTVQMAKKVIDKALKARQIGSHEMNSRSNRSHFITDIFVELPGQSLKKIQNQRHQNQNQFPLPGDEMMTMMEENREYTIMGKISFVDLAGSERLKNTNSTGKVLLETGSINSSLYVLGKVIASLSKNMTSEKKREVSQPLLRLLLLS